MAHVLHTVYYVREQLPLVMQTWDGALFRVREPKRGHNIWIAMNQKLQVKRWFCEDHEGVSYQTLQHAECSCEAALRSMHPIEEASSMWSTGIVLLLPDTRTPENAYRWQEAASYLKRINQRFEDYVTSLGHDAATQEERLGARLRVMVTDLYPVNLLVGMTSRDRWYFKHDHFTCRVLDWFAWRRAFGSHTAFMDFPLFSADPFDPTPYNKNTFYGFYRIYTDKGRPGEHMRKHRSELVKEYGHAHV